MHGLHFAAAGLVLAAIAACSALGGAEARKIQNWDDKLTAPYEEWKPLKDVLKDLAARAGAEVAFAEDTKAIFVFSLPAGTTLKEAVQKAAATCGMEAAVEGNQVTVRKGGRVPSWVELAGGRGVAVVEGNVRGGIDLPASVDANRPIPWVWYAPNGLGPYHAWIARRLFEQGIALASVNVGESQGNPAGRAIFTQFYELAVKKHGLAKKAVLFPQSRGGLMLYNWAAEHPECVAAVGGVYPVCNPLSYPGLAKAAEAYGMTPEQFQAELPKHNPLDRLGPLAKAGIPIFHVHGDKDGAVPLEKNSAELEKRYKALGGQVRILVIPGLGHEGMERGAPFFQCKELVDFLIAQAKAAGGERPASAPAAP